MADTTKFVLEGDFTLAYFGEESDSKHVLIKDEDKSSDAVVGGSNTRLEAKIAEELGFPTNAEFDEIFERNEKLREQGLRSAAGEPDMTRENVQLRITVEVLN